MEATFAGHRLLDSGGDRWGAVVPASSTPVVGPGRLAVVDALEPGDGRRVRLALLPPIDGDLVRRTVVRARTVDHPHVLADVEVVEDGGRVGVVVPWTDGGTLAQLLAVRGTISPAELLTVLRPLAGALIAIGDAGLCHGALCPELVFFDADGRPRLAGPGVGLAIAVATGEDRILPVGAPHLAPEIARGSVPDIRADLFALGSLALLAVSGRPAWPAEDATEVLVQSAAGLWPEAAAREATPEVAAIIEGLLSSDPSLRPPAAVVQAELRSAGRPRPVDLTPLWSAPDDGEDSADARRTLEVMDDAAREDVAVAGAGTAPARSGWGPEDPGDAEPLGARGRHGARSGPRRQSPDSGRPGRRRRAENRRGHRVGVAAIVAMVIGGLAAAGGLWWAAGGRPPGAAVDAAAPPVASALPTAPVLGDDPTADVTIDRPGDPGAGDTAVFTASVDWLSVLRDLDRRRADALAAADPDLLDTVYVAGPARDADRALVADLRARGLRVDGGAHVISSVEPASTDTPPTGPSDTDVGLDVRLGVQRSLPAYPVIDDAGRAVGSTASAGSQAAVVTVRAVGDGFAIVDVRPA